MKTPRPASARAEKPSPEQFAETVGRSDRRPPLDVLRDQHYTHPDVAAHFYAIFQEHFDPAHFQMVEPSAGTGSFLKLLPPCNIAYDIDPKHPNIIEADFLTVEIKSNRMVATIGNPPFGRNSSLAVRFFNHAATKSSVIALILPRTFRKASVENRLDRNFHLLRDEEVPSNAFLFRSKTKDVPAAFQIWERRHELRALRPVKRSHPDFEFTTAEHADFAMKRVGAGAGRIHHDFTKSRFQGSSPQSDRDINSVRHRWKRHCSSDD